MVFDRGLPYFDWTAGQFLPVDRGAGRATWGASSWSPSWTSKARLPAESTSMPSGQMATSPYKDVRVPHSLDYY